MESEIYEYLLYASGIEWDELNVNYNGIFYTTWLHKAY